VTAAPSDQHPTCSVAFCPICLVVTTIGEARPELVDHLMAAGLEILLAARTAIDARVKSMELEEPRKGLQRIDIE
jgi:hypothetical protein